MVQSRSEMLVLRRADSGQDLWAAIEAGQYARLVEHDPPRTDVEAGRIRELVDLFSDCSERWEKISTADQMVALEQLGSRLTALEEVELFVYWTIFQGRLDTAEGRPVELPVAVLTIARDGQPSITVNLPEAMGVE